MPTFFKRFAATIVSVVLVSAVMVGGPVSPAFANGESWSPVEAPEPNSWRSVAYGDGVWVGVSSSGTSRVMRSTDGGVAWSAVAPVAGVPEANTWNSVAYGNGVWVAVAGSGTNRVMRSTDGGATWSAVAPVAGVPEANTWNSVAYGNGVWVAVASSGTNRVMRSTDGGVAWSAVAPVAGVPEANAWRSVAYGNGVWVAVSTTGTNRVMRSENDGQAWSAVAAPEVNHWRSVAYGNGVWVAVASDNECSFPGLCGPNRVMRSPNNGVTWTAVAATDTNDWFSVAYGNGVWVAVASSGTNRVMRSTNDGVNWSAVAAAEANPWNSVAYGNGVWVAVASGGTNRVMRSLDPVSRDSSPPSTAESAGLPGIFLYIAASAGRSVEGAPVYHGSAGIAPNTSYTLSAQSMGARALTRTVLATGVTNGRGHVEGRIQLGALAPGPYKIVMTGSHPLGYPLVLTNHIVVDAAGKFVSVSAESRQPFLN